MKAFQRVVLIILDGVGVGALPDADEYNDTAAATLQNVAAVSSGLSLPHLAQLGLGRIVAIQGVATVDSPTGCWGKMAEQSPGKDSVTGHWEIAGYVLDKPFATFPNGFPASIIDSFTAVSGLKPLGNMAASGTDILQQLGEEHLETGRPIVYTSSDSVFQIAAHEKVLPAEKLYALCRQIEKILLPFNICRVIARPFVGDRAENFCRTSGRHDFPRPPSSPTLLDLMQKKSLPTWGIGKIQDLFAGRGISHAIPTNGNSAGMVETLRAVQQIKNGLVMTNLVDFDMLYGHRLDIAGFAAALEDFDRWLPELLKHLKRNDLLIITADHGCDPTTPGTDHTREFVPLLAWSPTFSGGMDLGVRKSFADVGATLAENFGTSVAAGSSFLKDLYSISN